MSDDEPMSFRNWTGHEVFRVMPVFITLHPKDRIELLDMLIDWAHGQKLIAEVSLEDES